MIMGITLKKIAEDLNISKTTVSFVLSGVGAKKGISEATQQRIIEYAKSHQYEPNLLAKSLYRGVSDTIGLIVPSISDMFYSQLAQEIELEAKKHGYMIIICTSERDAKQEVKMIRMLKAKQVDGLIMAPTEHCKTELNHLLDEKFPFVLIDRYFPDFDSNYVVLDDFAATRTLINNMIRQGRRNIALVTTDSNVSAIYLRTEAYLKVTSQEKLEYNPALCCVVRRNDYADDIAEESLAATYSFDVWDFMEEIASNAEELDILKNYKSWMEESNARLASVESKEEKKRLMEQNEKEDEERFKKVDSILNSPRAREVIGGKVFVEDMRRKIHVLDSIGTDSCIKTVLLYEDAYKRIDYTRKPLTQEIMDSLALWTGNSSVLQGIREKNEFYTALANRKLDQLVLKTGSEVEGLQEGKEILSKLTEPYRGKFILLDIWGTWCGPCKDALSHAQEMYQRLAKYDLQYMYLANHSPKDTWENVIKEYNVTGSNVVHFNLPPEQQQAVERYLKIFAFPTYKVIDPEGRVLDVKVDPRNLDSTEKLFQMLTGK